MQAPSPFPPDIAAAVGAAVTRGVPLTLDVHWFERVASTMDVTAEAAASGAPEGFVAAANEQSSGRGRRGRSWSSPPGAGLYLTFLLRPPASPHLPLLTLAAGVAVRDAIARAADIKAELKWPNDVMVGRRKLAGILAEGVGIGSADQVVLLGIGINVLRTSHPHEVERRATSVEAELGQSPSRARLLEELLVAVPMLYDRLRRGGADDILRTWRAASPSATDHRVAWHDAGSVREGVTAGVDDSGALLVTTARGIERVRAGELDWGL